jgi:hypothetical protein
VDALGVQQAKAYPEIATGVFASLADFEDGPGGRGHEQVRSFRIQPSGEAAGCKFVVNLTRTGAGALEATVPAGGRLVYAVAHPGDFTRYTLLSMAVHSRALRDDLEVALTTDGSTWRSPATLVEPGWNTVLIDIRRLAGVRGFDLASVRTMEIGFADAAGPVTLNLDDVMTVVNERTIGPTPPGLVLRKSGLDYTLSLPGHADRVPLAQGSDGLWRLGALQPVLRLGGGAPAQAGGEDVELMGRRRVGRVELLEHNAVRLRLANTWFFPSRAGEWASLAVRQVRWEHTFYGDGRCVTEVTVNNAGGEPIRTVELALPWEGAWAGGRRAARFAEGDLGSPVGRWRFLLPPPGPGGKPAAENYLRPGRVVPRIASADAFAPGDADRDGYDESQGCFFLKGRNGHCRFTYQPPEQGARNPVFVVADQWSWPVHVSSEGRTLRDVVRREDGSAVLMLSGLVDREALVEVTGAVAYRGGSERPVGGKARP